MVNVVCLSGRFVADPDVKRVGAKSTAMVRFKLAVETRYLQGGEWKSKVNYPSCLAWGRTAEHIGKSAAKGTFASLQGRFETGSYEKDGKTYYTNDVLVAEIDIPVAVASAGAPPPADPMPDDSIPF